MPKLVDLTGQRFGYLTVIERAPNKGRFVAWKCNCDCGNETVVTGQDLRTSHTRSCGCLQRAIFSDIAKENKTHGASNSRIYKSWTKMKIRCYNKNSKSYKDYGGRGITVCKEWMEFGPFYKWALSHGYADDLTLDRIDVNGNYCPENCRWATQLEQSNNKRNNRFITIDGETHTVSEWSRISNIKKVTIRNRLEKGWTEKDAVFHPLLRKRRNVYETH